MVKELNRNYKQSMWEAMDEFPDCRILMIIDNIMDNDGVVVAISDDSSTEDELSALRKNYPKDTIFFVGGTYKDAFAVGLQTVVETGQV